MMYKQINHDKHIAADAVRDLLQGFRRNSRRSDVCNKSCRNKTARDGRTIHYINCINAQKMEEDRTTANLLEKYTADRKTSITANIHAWISEYFEEVHE